MADDEFANATILIVDDDAHARRLLGAILGKLQVARVLEAEDGVKALAVMESEKSVIDLMITDIDMPELDGWGLARRVRYGEVPRFKDIPIFMLTGHDSESNNRKAQIYKVDTFLLKPPNKNRLAELMRAHIST